MRVVRLKVGQAAITGGGEGWEQRAGSELFEGRRYLEDRLGRPQEEAPLIWHNSGVADTNGAQPPHPSSLSDQQLEMLHDGQSEQDHLRHEFRI